MSDHHFTLSDTTLKKSYWLVTHRPVIKKLFLGFFIGLDCLLVIIVLGSLINFYGLQFSSFSETLTTLGAQTNRESSSIVAAEELTYGRIGSLPYNDATDLYAEITNPNSTWRADIVYSFVVNGKKGETKKGYLFPHETKFFLELNRDISNPTATEFVIDHITWNRVGKTSMEALTEKVRFVVSDFLVSHPQKKGIYSISQASFSVRNDTGYAYWSVGLPIILLNGESVVAVTYLTAENMERGEERTIEAKWFHALPLVNSYIIQPEVDIFNPASFRIN